MEIRIQFPAIRFCFFSRNQIFGFGKFLSNGIWWISKDDAGFYIKRGVFVIWRFAITWHGLYGQ